MNKIASNNNYIKFLKDEKFIEWMLYPTSELEAYWKEFLLNNPQEIENLGLAEEWFQNINFDSQESLEEKRIVGLKKLEKSLNVYSRKKRLKVINYLTAACLTLAFVVGALYINQSSDTGTNIATEKIEYIIGNELISQDISLISESKTTSFTGNIDIQIDGNGKAEVKTDKKQREEITIGRKTMNKLVVPYGKRSSIVLADGTQVWVNSGTVLQFPSEFENKRRDIHLVSGEVYIEVAGDKTKPFYLHTTDFDVKVYGTSFNVSVYDDSPKSVVLVEGSLGLRQDKVDEVLLIPNERALYTEEGIFSKKSVDVSQFISWKNGYLVFDNTPMIEVLKQVGRYYNLSFSFENEISLNSAACSGKLDLSNSLDELMRTVALLSGTNFNREGMSVYISSKNNN